MHTPPTRLGLVIALLAAVNAAAQEANPRLPPALEPWQDWVTWDERHADCPSPYNNAGQHLCFWPSRLLLQADASNGSWELSVTVFEKCWVPLPGDTDIWPLEVTADGDAVVVVSRDGHPNVKLPPGDHTLSGAFRWRPMPQKVAIPKEVGLVALQVEGQDVPLPNWDTSGHLWLRRIQRQEEAKDQLTRRVYRVLEDGVPMWLITEVSLGVSGKSREETLGALMPEGWKLATIDSPIPVAVDDRGVMKAQVRAGQWTITAHAYRTHDLKTFRYAAGAEPSVVEELLGFRADPQFRIAEIEGAESVDANQTTFPQKWRSLPIYRWKTNASFQLVERQRGMGDEAPAGLNIARELWLDQDGQAGTYRDQVQSNAFHEWRLDAADGQELGAVRVGAESQLITANPNTGADGVEVRDRRLSLEAVGRTTDVRNLPATGWQSDADDLRLTLNLPPGWRVLAVFGADSIEGDWLTSWSLLDLFLLLVFATAVARMWNWRAGLLALLALGLAYHEPGVPRLTWLFLLAPLALLQVVKDGAGHKFLVAWKYLAFVLLAVFLIPFLANQVQSALFPQLEPHGVAYRQRPLLPWLGIQAARRASQYDQSGEDFGLPMQAEGAPPKPASIQDRFGRESVDRESQVAKSRQDLVSNMAQSPKAIIQTGPATPTWSWNRVLCYWSGPVDQSQRVRPVLIPPFAHRLLTVARLVLLLLLAALLLGMKLPRLRPRGAAAVLMLFGLLWPSAAQAQLPDQQLLETLRQRLLEPNDAFPNAAEIPTATLTVDEGRLTLSAEVHAAASVAVPLPGQFPSWSPLSARVDGEAQAVLRRRDGYLWLMLSEGVHRVEVEGLLPDASEWQWTFLLKPHHVEIAAPEWTVTGVKQYGVPEDQVFFVRKQERSPGEATYDQRHFNVAVVVDRQLEIGLVWKVHNTVRRVSQPGKAVALRIPLLEGERVLTASANVEEDHINARLGAGQQEYRWESELPIAPQVQLETADTDQWVEQWRLMLSPVWNTTFTGLPPVFQEDAQKIEPVWRPWPGEQATLAFYRPEAIEGDTVTIHEVRHETSLGTRLRTATLNLETERSLAGDFVIQLSPGAKVTSVKMANSAIPVRRDGDQLIVPSKPGRQRIEVTWKLFAPLESVASCDAVTLPVESANVTSVLEPPSDRWVLWSGGPLRGPAVRFWTIIVVAVLAGLALGRVPHSPLRRWEWVLLALGLTQVNVAAALVVVAWLLIFAWRGRMDVRSIGALSFDALQCLLVLLTLAALAILLVVVREGLLGDPEMFIIGNDSSPAHLQWFAPRSGPVLPQPFIVSVSVWWYRVLMLFWALWLASALVRWLNRGWQQFTHGAAWRRVFRRRRKRAEQSS